MLQRILVLALVLASGSATADADVTYLANAGLMLTKGDTRVLFDPLFRDDYGHYQLLPQDIEDSMMSGDAPFDGVDAVFVSHYHGDHFSAEPVLEYLRRHPQVRLYAPLQATEILLQIAGDGDQDVIERLTGLDIDYGEAAAEIRLGELFIEAFHIPHSGWPDRQPVVQNLAFRVTVDGTTVLHLGDADTRDEHFVLDAARWQQRDIDAAFPPYWFFSSAAGRAILEQRLRPALAIGIHVPVDVDPQYADGIEGYALFRRPGERRSIDADE